MAQVENGHTCELSGGEELCRKPDSGAPWTFLSTEGITQNFSTLVTCFWCFAWASLVERSELMMAVPYTVSSGPGGDLPNCLLVREVGEWAISHTPTFQHFKSKKVTL